ncbi:MAG: AraC family transcriptional regulator [Tannerella sp.]|jgi:AraC-like DNA-binding protein|nr:AraC family transcriptional regulator [Tannerella sp.]
MDYTTEQSLWGILEWITDGMKYKNLADVFRFKSFSKFETFGPHEYLRIEINYVKKGSCIIRLDNESIGFNENELMIIHSEVMHFFEAGANGCTLLQLEFLPDIFSGFDSNERSLIPELKPVNIFSEANKLIKIVNNVRIVRAIQRIVNELEAKNRYYRYLVIMYYAELLILIYRHLSEAFLPICSNDAMKRALSFIGTNFCKQISVSGIAKQSGISERYLRKLFERHLKLSPLEYLNRIRVDKSIELLRNTEMSVKEVCYACGFGSPQRFSKIFKQHTGSTPREITK